MLKNLLNKSKRMESKFIPQYDYVLSEHDNLVKIKLLDGTYKDTIFTYGRVSIDEKNNGECVLTFDYDVIESPVENIKDDVNFKNVLGDILVRMIVRNLETGGIDETGTNDTEEFDI